MSNESGAGTPNAPLSPQSPVLTAWAEGYRRALALLRQSAGPAGFVASPCADANYRRVWARDGVICGLAGLLSGDAELIQALERTLETLRAHQGEHGEIPSNVALDGQVSYGTLAGRADAPLWYVIGAAALGAVEPAAIGRHEAAMRRALAVAAAWEFNQRGLIYVPLGGSWADEYILHGYVLHAQLLHLWALRAAGAALADDGLVERGEQIAALIADNYWLDSATRPRYHPGAYAAALARVGPSRYWSAGFHPGGYQEVFDGLGNGLALLLGLGHAESVAAFVAQLAEELGTFLTPAFYPPITPADASWPELRGYHLFAFRNHPWEYHNGGLWPMVTGFLAAGLAASDQPALARRLAAAITAANAQGDWGFHEYHHGRTHQPSGVRQLAWSAAGAVIAHHALAEGRTPHSLTTRMGTS